ncbi:MAG: Sugar phosphate isomerase/epimerase [Chloroflexi bacterium]|jgi:sugar phosphate isomerase/epimerase|nr:Sugar phosphate isomerase/epimerase [Chloroflexota bacterium]
MHKLAVSEVTTHDWSFGEDVQHYVAAGLDGIGVWRDKLDNFGTEQSLTLLAASGLQVANLVDAGYFLSKTRSQTKRAIEDVVEAIDLAKTLKTDCLLIVTGDIGSFYRTYDQAQQIVIDSLKQLAPVAQQAGVRLAIEPINQRYPGYTFLHDIPSTLKVIEAVGSAMVGLFFDMDHLYESPNLFADIAEAGERIFCVHLNDMPAAPGPGIDRRILGEGIIPLKEIVAAIDATGYQGFYDIEIMSDAVWKRDYTELLNDLKSRFADLWE